MRRWQWALRFLGTVAVTTGCGDDSTVTSGTASAGANGSSTSFLAATSTSTSAMTHSETSVEPSATAEATTGGDTSGMSTSLAPSTGRPETTTDLPEVDCETTLVSDLPGMELEIESPCVLSVGQAQAGVSTAYTVVVTEALSDIDSGTPCTPTPEAGVVVTWAIVGPGHQHCTCDTGACAPYTPSPTDLAPGEFAGGFEWFGFDWAGPSDTNAPFGDPFPAGDYVIEVTVTGFQLDDNAVMVPFSVVGRRPIVLVDA